MIVGLGNPGQTYRDTRHNAGFMVIQLLGERHHVDLCRRTVGRDGRPAAVSGHYEAGGDTVRLMMPLTMMNESGEALREAAAERADLLIVCDDVNLPLGTLRMRPDGSAGGHHGLRSCLAVLGTEEIPRLRLGVGCAEPLPSDLREFVLSPFRSAERPVMKRMLEQAADACETWVTKGMDVAMNQYNRAVDA
ncbi:MAG: aminoacyl-tRNA hydrolase [Candidatus Omnitrophica bacterium]|nr:aminoacyl-tRNA hydrolase [Candidatus Omnitrophota bacterium]